MSILELTISGTFIAAVIFAAMFLFKQGKKSAIAEQNEATINEAKKINKKIAENSTVNINAVRDRMRQKYARD